MRREWNKQKIYQNKKENKMQNATQTNNARLELIKASEIEPKKIEWLWYPFIPYGKVTLLQGDPGDGKSTFMLTIAALLTRGEPLPFTETGKPPTPISVIISAVMHADEINKAVTEELGKPVYHYHLHIVAIPTVRKEIRWSKRCKDEALRGTVKEVINQVSHSKKWESKVPELDENGQVVRNEKGKTVFRKSYSVLQDKLFEHLTAAGFTGFERGELGSTAENLKSLDFQIEKDKERLAQTEQKVNKAKKELAEIRGEVRTKQKVAATYGEIDALGSKGITGKYTVTKQELDSLKALAKEGVSSRSEIHDLKRSVSYYQRQAMDLSSRLSNVKERLKEVTEKYERLVEITKPYLMALQHFPDKVKEFFERLFPQKERAEEREAPKPARKPKMRDDWAR